MTARSIHPLYDSARHRKQIWQAWEVVNRNARRSKASKTRDEAERFQRKLLHNIEKIARALKERRFKFSPQRAVGIPKKDGKIRPLIVAPIDNRIVQRSILDTLQAIPSIRAKLEAGFNFGGVGEKGVPDAVHKVADHCATHPFFIRTDVCSFFQNVRRKEALDSLVHGIDDVDFLSLVRDAVTTELDDATEHLAETGIFPLQEEGVQQGSCLSPLICNVLLHPLDVQMNGRNVITVRYIDDFIVLAATESAARKAFESARRWLREHGLNCYDPFDEKDASKAEHGNLVSGADFLGCHISTKGIRPSRRNFQRLRETIDRALKDSLLSFKNPSKAQLDKTTFAETLTWASETVRGWGNTFSFCTDERLFRDIDQEIGESLYRYEQDFLSLRTRMKHEDSRRALGVFPLCDRKRPSRGAAMKPPTRDAPSCPVSSSTAKNRG